MTFAVRPLHIAAFVGIMAIWGANFAAAKVGLAQLPPPLLRIDHCFGSGVRVDDFQVVAIRGSDHSGLVVDL